VTFVKTDRKYLKEAAIGACTSEHIPVTAAVDTVYLNLGKELQLRIRIYDRVNCKCKVKVVPVFI
jgi:hypothetical protein